MNNNKISRSLLAVAVLSAVAASAQAATTELQMQGYVRGSTLVNQDGNKGDSFRLNGNFGRYRLGNEQDSKVEFDPVMNMKSNNGAIARVKATFSAEGACTADWNCVDSDGHDAQFRQGYIELSNLDFAPNQLFWAGKRNDMYNNGSHMYDWDAFDTLKGVGGGVHKMNLGFANMDLNMVSYDSATGSNPTGSATAWWPKNGNGYATIPDNYGFATGYDVQTWLRQIGGTGLDMEFVWSHDNNAKTYLPSTDSAQKGYQVGVMYNFANYFGLANGCCSYIGAQYGKGVGAGDRLGRNGWGYANLEDTKSWRLSAAGVAQMGKVEFQTFIMYQKDTNYRNWSDSAEGWDRSYFTAGIRPIHQITRNFSMQYQIGYEYLNDENNGNATKGGMTVLTVAPTLNLEPGYWGRPQIRLFATYAKWSDGLMGSGKSSYLAGSNAFQYTGTDGALHYETSGMNFGIQGEVWF